MVKTFIENNCVGCPQGCIDCGRKKQLALEALVCDNCGEEVDKLYITSTDEQLCEECVLDDLYKITYDNYYDYVQED